MSDPRDIIYVHAEVPSSDDVRVFYEIPSVVADFIRLTAPDVAFVDALVTVYEGIDALYDLLDELCAGFKAYASGDDAEMSGPYEDARAAVAARRRQGA